MQSEAVAVSLQCQCESKNVMHDINDMGFKNEWVISNAFLF